MKFVVNTLAYTPPGELGNMIFYGIIGSTVFKLQI